MTTTHRIARATPHHGLAPALASAVALAGLLGAPAARAGEARSLPAAQVPAEVRPFVLPGTTVIALERADLDGDGRADVVLVLERQKARPTDDDIEDGQRPLLVLLRQADGSLRLAARNDAVVYCATCGGMMGDPFVGVSAGPGTFTVSNFGGSAWRWSAEYRFDHSRRDAAWQLVRVTESTFHASQPERMKTVVSRPPKAFGKIDLNAFDPEKWRGQGLR